MRLLVLDGPERITPKLRCDDVISVREPCPVVRMGCALWTVLALSPVQLFVMHVDWRAPVYGAGDEDVRIDCWELESPNFWFKAILSFGGFGAFDVLKVC